MRLATPLLLLVTLAGGLRAGDGLVQGLDGPAPVTTGTLERGDPAADAEAPDRPAGGPGVERGLVVERSVVIEAPVEAVWAYLADDAHARAWSVYFHHITPLPGPPPGTVGALRRCFRAADEQGVRWDERLEAVVPLRLRRIRMFDVRGLPLGRLVHDDVWQVYEPLGPARTRLTFRSAPREGATPAERLAFRLARARGAEVFERNLENIRAAVEGRPPPNAYAPPGLAPAASAPGVGP